MEYIPTVSQEYSERFHHRQSSSCTELWTILDQVKDPEVPVLSIWDLGVLQDINVDEGQITVVITPTYSGCPAMYEIESEIRKALSAADHSDVEVVSRLTPTWTTDWMSPEGKAALRRYGISPPEPALRSSQSPACPQCGSGSTTLVSEFGSTACKALYKCDDCLEPFDYFKCI